MPDLDFLSDERSRTDTEREPDRRPTFRHILACVDSSPLAPTVIAHAKAVAEATGARVSVVQVMEPPAAGEVPADPVAWGLRRREAEARLAELAEEIDESIEARAAILEGNPAERISHWAEENDVDLAVLGSHGEAARTGAGLGATARRLIEILPASVLLLPPGAPRATRVRYRRVMVPLDCSARAETALPVAVALASAHEADLILVHASPSVDLVEVGPLEAEDIELRERLRKRNERVARSYLSRVQARLFFGGGGVQIRLLTGDDPRHAIARAAMEERADIIVLSSIGTGGHPDLPVGSVADYLITHLATPILVVRDPEMVRERLHRQNAAATSPRLPSQALS